MALSETEKDLIHILKALEIDEETTVGVTTLLRTDENREMMLDFIIARYKAKKEITDDLVIKALLKITKGVPKKENGEKDHE